MRALTNAEILEVWERGWQALPAQRAVLLLATAAPETAPGEVAGYSVGRRDAQLLRLRGLMFGPKIVSLTPCPECGAGVELEFDVGDFSAPALPAESTGDFTIIVDDYEVSFRLPNSPDQIAIAEAPDTEAARRILLGRCVKSARREGAEVLPDLLPPAVMTAMTDRMAELDPLASVFLTVRCPDCRRQWQSLFDICDFFWRELTSYARRLAQEVHLLASAYGWGEAEILSMSSTRRRLYLEMISR
jgi:hypothetical protein